MRHAKAHPISKNDLHATCAGLAIAKHAKQTNLSFMRCATSAASALAIGMLWAIGLVQAIGDDRLPWKIDTLWRMQHSELARRAHLVKKSGYLATTKRNTTRVTDPRPNMRPPN